MKPITLVLPDRGYLGVAVYVDGVRLAHADHLDIYDLHDILEAAEAPVTEVTVDASWLNAGEGLPGRVEGLPADVVRKDRF